MHPRQHHERHRHHQGGRLAALALVAICALGLLCGLEREGGRDFHWHVVLGEQTLHAGGPVHTEQLSYTNHGAPVFVSAWLADVVLAVAFRAGGYAGCQLLRSLCLALVLLFLWLHCRRRGASVLASTALVVLALAGALPRFYLRPEMFAFAIGAAVLLLLEVHERTRRRAALVGVVALVALWANMHGSVIVGLAAISLYALEQAVRRRGDRVEALALPLVAFAASCLNPEGVRLPLAFRIVSPNFSTYIAEWRPLARGLVSVPVLLMGLAALATTLRAGRRVSPWRLGLVLVLSVLSYRYHRFLSHLLFAMVPLIGDNVGGAQRLEGADERPRARLVESTLFVAAGVFAAIFLVAGRGVLRRVGIGTEPGTYPERACEFVRSARPTGHVLNTYDYGDYLLWCLPGQPVFLDQRAWSAYPDAFFGRYVEAMTSTDALRKLVDDYQIEWAFLSDTDAIAEEMTYAPDAWRLLYFDDNTLVFRKRRAGETGAAADDGLRFLNPINLIPVINAQPPSFPRIRQELALQEARCPTCWRTHLVRAAFSLAENDLPAFERAVAALTPADQQRPEVEFVRARHALATRRFALAAALYKHLRKVGTNPLGAAALEAEALHKGGDAAGARRVIDELAHTQGGEQLAAQLRIQLLGELPTVVPTPGIVAP